MKGDMMDRGFLIECPDVLKEGLFTDKNALNSFLCLDFFRQRSISNYVINAVDDNERNKRVNEVLASLIERQNFPMV